MSRDLYEIAQAVADEWREDVLVIENPCARRTAREGPAKASDSSIPYAVLASQADAWERAEGNHKRVRPQEQPS